MIPFVQFFFPSLIMKGPKQSIPEYTNGGEGSTRSVGRSLIRWPSTDFLSLLHGIQLRM